MIRAKQPNNFPRSGSSYIKDMPDLYLTLSRNGLIISGYFRISQYPSFLKFKAST